ncbi:MAG: hypothetical protein H6559_37435 [Lewinellaceae bacterium]|nr:hypothetical protein [Lewinellaceae bacterium]
MPGNVNVQTFFLLDALAIRIQAVLKMVGVKPFLTFFPGSKGRELIGISSFQCRRQVAGQSFYIRRFIFQKTAKLLRPALHGLLYIVLQIVFSVHRRFYFQVAPLRVTTYGKGCIHIGVIHEQESYFIFVAVAIQVNADIFALQPYALLQLNARFRKCLSYGLDRLFRF